MPGEYVIECFKSPRVSGGGMRMMRLVYLCSLFGVLGWTWCSSGSVIALAPVIDTDPAPGRSPGPPLETNKPAPKPPEPKPPLTTTHKRTEDIDGLGYLTHNHTSQRHQQGFNIAQRSGGHTVKSDEWTVAVDGNDQRQREPALNKLEPAISTESPFSHTSAIHRGESANEKHRLRRSSSQLSVAVSVQDSDMELEDDGHFVNLFCGGDTGEERLAFRESYLNILDDVVVSLPSKDYRLPDPVIKGKGKRRSVSGPGKEQSKRSEATKGSIGVGHRFQRVVVEGNLTTVKVVTGEPGTSKWWSRGPQSSSGGASLREATNNRHTNNRLPVLFDVTHDVFEARGGLVTNVEYLGELVSVLAEDLLSSSTSSLHNYYSFN